MISARDEIKNFSQKYEDRLRTHPNELELVENSK